MRRAAGLALAVVLAATLAACLPLDGEQLRLCRSALPALEPDGRIRVLEESVDERARSGIRIEYLVEDHGRWRPGLLRCGFGGGRLDDRRLDIAAVEIAGRQLGDARLLFLKRFWLADRGASADGLLRVEGIEPRPLLGLTTGAGSGYLAQQVVNAAPLGAIYALLALAYAFIYGLSGRINLAFGEIAVVGAHALVAGITAGAAVLAGLGSGGALVLAALVGLVAALQTGLLGAVIGRTVFRPLARASHRAFLIATIGVSVALAEAVRLAAGSRERWLQPVLNEPVLIARGDFPVTLTAMQFVEVAAALGVLAAVAVLMRFGSFGSRWRAVADDPLMARLVGIDPDRVALASFTVSAAIAGAAGALTALHYGHASYSAGLMIGLKALVAALLGGIGSLPGAAAGGLAIGLAETLWSAYLPLAHRDVAILSALVAVLVLRPDGLFGRPAPSRDSLDARWSGLG